LSKGVIIDEEPEVPFVPILLETEKEGLNKWVEAALWFLLVFVIVCIFGICLACKKGLFKGSN